MADDPLSNLMRSPFEDGDAREKRREPKEGGGGGAGWWPLPSAVAIGGLVALGGLLFTGGEDAPPPTNAGQLFRSLLFPEQR